LKDLLPELVPRVYRFALRLTCDVHSAEEIVQETFLRAWRKREHIRNPGATRVWLFRIAVNVWKDLSRRRRLPIESAGPLPEDAAGVGPPPDRIAANHEEVQLVIEIMDSLPARQRQVLYLSAIEELKRAEIARVLGISADAVKANLSLARKAMRRRLRPYLNADERTDGPDRVQPS
jgi:RNA polymerase sigma-70 factor (ECF subfamily)